MDDDLPNEFDLVVVGTGFSESVIAAAASRIGKTVLHLDPNEFYGGTWASFNFEAFQNFLNNCKTADDGGGDDDCIKYSEENLKVLENCSGIIGAKQQWHINYDEETTAATTTNDATKIITDVDEVPLPSTTATTTETTAEETPINKSTDDDNLWTKEKILKNFRKFNIDLVPKILFGGGKLVELLISSNICRYAEFRAVDKICTIFNNGEIKNVPCSRTDVFNTKDLSMVEKRLLMKLLTNCMNYNDNDDGGENNDRKQQQQEDNDGKGGQAAAVADTEETKKEFTNIMKEFHEYDGKTFLEYLQGQKLTEKIIHCVLYAISMCNVNTTLKVGIERTKKFLNSLGRYGNTPFLFPMYGCGELPQDFCRLCAVFGGIYCLKRSIENIRIENDDKKNENDGEGKKTSITKLTIKCGNQENIKVKNLIIGSNNIPNGLITTTKTASSQCGGLSRAVFITSTPIGDNELNSGGGGVNIMRLPPPLSAGEKVDDNNNDDSGAFIIQLSHYSGTCPKGLYLIHITTPTKTYSAENDLKPYISQIFTNDENTPKILYSAYFIIPKCKCCRHRHSINNKTKQKDDTDVVDCTTTFSNIYTTCGPFYELDYDKSLANAYEIFRKLYPNEEFLPRAPDPEEIIIGDEDPTDVKAETITSLLDEQNVDIAEKQIKQEIQEEGIENEVKCVENAKNEEKDDGDKED